MNSPIYPHRALAARILVICCLFWAFSFPVMKALQLLASHVEPQGNSIFASAAVLMCRFGASTLLVAMVLWKDLGRITRLEWIQGGAVGFFGSFGLLFQVDGLAYTDASISAFLTQGYCVLIPLWLAIRRRRLPTGAVWISCSLAIVGAAVLAGVRWDHLHLGRGEWETLLGSVFFAAQIFWVDDARFAGNNTLRWSFVMFATMAVLGFVIAAVSAPSWGSILRVYSSPSAWGLIAILVLGCTLVSFLLMNRWQRELPPTEAGLLYCTEPVFTSVVSLIVPGWISKLTQLPYENELLTWRLIAGGAFILAANVWLQLKGSEVESKTT